MTIRIGSDILMSVRLTDDEARPITVVSLHAYLINHPKQTSALGLTQYQRFPHEPQIDAYSPTLRYINQSGDYIYNIQPKNVMCGLGPIHDVKVVDVNPEYVRLLYQACHQHQLGFYDLVVVAKVIDNTYPDLIRTITVDKTDVFELVKHTGDDSEFAQIDVSIDTSIESTIRCVLMSGNYDSSDPFVSASADGKTLMSLEKSGYDQVSVILQASEYGLHVDDTFSATPVIVAAGRKTDANGNIVLMCWDPDWKITNVYFKVINNERTSVDKVKIEILEDPDTSEVINTLYATRDNEIEFSQDILEDTNSVCLNVTVPDDAIVPEGGDLVHSYWSLYFSNLVLTLVRRQND